MASTPDDKTLPYRPCVGIMLVNMDGKVFVGQRIDNSTEAWQMPQGGIDEDEDARAAALRELREETGIGREHVEIIAKSKDEHFYDLPPELIGKLWGGKYRGPRPFWFLARFVGALVRKRGPGFPRAERLRWELNPRPLTPRARIIPLDRANK